MVAYALAPAARTLLDKDEILESMVATRGPEKHTKNPPWPENHTKIADPQNHTKNGDNGLKNTLANNAYSTVLPRVLLVLQ